MNRKVLAAVDDMFFASKIRTTAEHLGVEVRFVRDVNTLIQYARENKPELIIVDLQSQKFDPLDIAKELRADKSLKGTPLLGFFSHVLTELQQKAQEAGYTTLLPRSAFSSRLEQILKG